MNELIPLKQNHIAISSLTRPYMALCIERQGGIRRSSSSITQIESNILLSIVLYITQVYE